MYLDLKKKSAELYLKLERILEIFVLRLDCDL